MSDKTIFGVPSGSIGEISNPLTSAINYDNNIAINIKSSEYIKQASSTSASVGSLKIYANNDDEMHQVTSAGVDTIIGGDSFDQPLNTFNDVEFKSLDIGNGITSYTLPLTRATSANQVIKDVAGNGVITWENETGNITYTGAPPTIANQLVLFGDTAGQNIKQSNITDDGSVLNLGAEQIHNVQKIRMGGDVLNDNVLIENSGFDTLRIVSQIGMVQNTISQLSYGGASFINTPELTLSDDLNVDGYIQSESLDNTGGTLFIGNTTTSQVIGKSATTCDFLGNVECNQTATMSGQLNIGVSPAVSYTMPLTRATVVNQVLKDVLGDGVVSWQTETGNITYTGTPPTVLNQLVKFGGVDGQTIIQSTITDDGAILNLGAEQIHDVQKIRMGGDALNDNVLIENSGFDTLRFVSQIGMTQNTISQLSYSGASFINTPDLTLSDDLIVNGKITTDTLDNNAGALFIGNNTTGQTYGKSVTPALHLGNNTFNQTVKMRGQLDVGVSGATEYSMPNSRGTTGQVMQASDNVGTVVWTSAPILTVLRFDASVDTILYEDVNLRFEWVTADMQCTYTMKVLPAGVGSFFDYIDTSISAIVGGAPASFNTDGQNVTGLLQYFSGPLGVIDIAYAHTNYGSKTNVTLTAENDFNYPYYRMEIKTGDIGLFGIATIEKIF